VFSELMVEPVRGVPRKANRGMRYVGVALLALIFLLGALYAYLFVRVVPPISGKVVDAITGKPVPSVNICLRVDTGGMGHSEIIRTEIVRTDDTGRFSFGRSFHDLHLLQEWQGFSIRLTDPRNDFAAPCGPDLGPGLNETHPDQRVSMNGYFPVALVEHTNATKSNRGWSSTRRPIGSVSNLNIPLIPVLSKSDACQQIRDPQLADDCRQLITEASASLK
jgi:hypothetical protein